MGSHIGPLYVRRSGFIEASPAEVWQRVASFEALAEWYSHGHKLEKFTPEVGAEVLLSVALESGARRFGGRLTVFEPEREMTYETNWHDGEAWSVPTFHTLRLAPLYSGTHVELLHHGFERLGANAGRELQNYEAGWHSEHLERLKALVEGTA
jgi:uncharacterized protein YndB with AHSA1/START domain